MSAASGPTMKTFQKRLYTALPRIQQSSSSAAAASSSSSSSSTSSLSSSPPTASSSMAGLANRTRSSSITHARTLYTASFTPGGSRGPPVSARLEGRVEGVELPNGSMHHPHSHAGQTSSGSGGVSSNPHNPPNMGPPAWHMGINASSYTPQTVLSPSSPYSYAYGYTPYPSLAGALDPSKEDPGAEGAWWLHTPETTSQADTTTLKFHLDVGAYGIPKRQRGGRSRHASYRTRPSSSSQAPSPQSTSTEDLSLAVPVGEDAYFIRPTAMGVADGVGGWSSRPSASSGSSSSTAHQREKSASALFARRLMHFCSAELDATPASALQPEATTSAPQPPSLPTPPSPGPPTHTYRAPLSALRARSTSPRPTPRLPLSNPTAAHAHANASVKTRVHSPRHNSIPLSPPGSPRLPASPRLNSNSGGLPKSPKTRAEAQLMNEQLEHELEEMEEGLDVLKILEKAYEKTLKAHVEPVASTSSTAAKGGAAVPESRRSSLDGDGERTCPALKITSSADAGSVAPATTKETKPLMAGSTTALLAILDNAPGDSSSAVLRIAHLGDSMGMLVRGEEIVWRTEEQWSSWNTPVQLGPRAGTKPSAAAVLTVPVQKDDILILATDGLSDNLWDQQVLKEVVRFRRQFLGSTTPAAGSEAEDDVRMGVGKEVGRRAMAGMLSEALCSLARRVSERGHGRGTSCAGAGADMTADVAEEEEEVPFTKRAREAGKVFKGGKADDISVVVAVISPS